MSFNSELILQTYSLEDIYEYNELTEEDVLDLLIKHGLVDIPNPKPIIYE